MSAIFSIVFAVFSSVLAVLLNLLAVFFAPASLVAHAHNLDTLLVRFNHNDPKSNKSSTHHIGSFSADSCCPSSSKYLYDKISLPSFVPNRLMSILRLSNGLVTHLNTADAFANAEVGALAIICNGLAVLSGSTFTPFSSSDMFSPAHRNLSQSDLFWSSRYLFNV